MSHQQTERQQESDGRAPGTQRQTLRDWVRRHLDLWPVTAEGTPGPASPAVVESWIARREAIALRVYAALLMAQDADTEMVLDLGPGLAVVAFGLADCFRAAAERLPESYAQALTTLRDIAEWVPSDLSVAAPGPTEGDDAVRVWRRDDPLDMTLTYDVVDAADKIVASGVNVERLLELVRRDRTLRWWPH